MKNWHSDWSCCELLSDFVYSFFEHNPVNRFWKLLSLWIAFRFCIFVLWTQSTARAPRTTRRCELLSDFVYSFFEHNRAYHARACIRVVNCFQILYIRSLNTICQGVLHEPSSCELLSDFVYSFFEHNLFILNKFCIFVVNCFQILYIRSLNTMFQYLFSKG